MASKDSVISNTADENFLLQDDSPQSFNSASEKTKHLTYANEDQLEEWRVELTKLEYEIQTLKSVLQAKHREAMELKKKLGITQMSEIKQDLQYGLQTVKESNAYQKTTNALRSFGSFASQKIGNLRNSNTLKSVEGKVGNAYSNVKHSKSVDQLIFQLSRLKTSKSTEGYERELEDKQELTTDDVDISTKLSVENELALSSPSKP